uniref:Tetraspanin n=1 Tax=Piliocolobus tephrosceles TaxID=591936 RepID=A0A8C9HG15_9PRIM
MGTSSLKLWKYVLCLLMSLFILLLIILLAKVTLAILHFVYEQKLNVQVAEGLMDSICHYHWDNSTKAMWDSIQSFLHCCGLNSKSDWSSGQQASCPSDPQVKGCYAKNHHHLCVHAIQVVRTSFALTPNSQIDKTSQALGV